MKRIQLLAATALAAVAAATATGARADAVTEWNITAGDIIVESRLGTPPAARAMAVVQTAVDAAVRQAVRTPGTSVEAAVAAANRATLGKLLPAQQASIDAAYAKALAAIADGPARRAGIAAGEGATAALLASRADDLVAGADSYRPLAAPGAYVPTAMPAASSWPQRRPWLMTASAQFRPAAPPALASEQWANDYNEVKSLGARVGSTRNAEQTEVARFWEHSLPSIYFGIVRSVADRPGRDVAANARLYAAVAQALDDGLIAVFDAKYHYHLWRPATAIRNGDTDGNDATERDAAWTPLVETPMHPEYPSAHSACAAAVGTVLAHELRGQPLSTFSTQSTTAKGATRTWTSIDAFVREVADARVWGGIHYRTATRAGAAIGQQVGELAARRLLEPAH